MMKNAIVPMIATRSRLPAELMRTANQVATALPQMRERASVVSAAARDPRACRGTPRQALNHAGIKRTIVDRAPPKPTPPAATRPTPSLRVGPT